MPDISMCSVTDCPLAERCYRHTAQPSMWQSYFVPEARGEQGRYFWPESAERTASGAGAVIGQGELSSDRETSG